MAGIVSPSRRSATLVAFAGVIILILSLFSNWGSELTTQSRFSLGSLTPIECAPSPPSIPSAPAPLETINIVAAMTSLDSAEEGGMMMKSALMYQSTPINFHLLVYPEAQKYIEKVFALVHSPVHDVQFFFYPIDSEFIEKRLDRTATGQGTKDPLMGAFRTSHAGGYMGMMKLFLHEVINEDVKRAIWLDTDAFFLSDPIITWRLFDTFGPETGIMMPSHDFGTGNEDWQTASRLCSCVYLMDLEVLRRRRYMYSTLFSAKDKAIAIGSAAVLQVWGPPKNPPYYNNLLMGDQAYFWATKVATPELFMHLPLSFEVTWCLWESYGVRLQQNTAEMTEEEQRLHQKGLTGTPDEENFIIPNILHFNCINDERSLRDVFFLQEFWTSPDNTPFGGQGALERWGPAVLYHGQYKFIWLNKGKRTVKMTTVKDLKFWDERMASQDQIAGHQ